MTKKKEEILKHIDAAIKLEETGIVVYSDMVKKTKNFYAGNMFERLANEEKKHKGILLNVKREILKDEEIERIDVRDVNPVNFKEIFVDRNKTTEEITQDYITALVFAVKAEEKSYLEYKELESISDDKKLKLLFDSLAKFEKNHWDNLRDELDFIEKSQIGAF